MVSKVECTEKSWDAWLSPVPQLSLLLRLSSHGLKVFLQMIGRFQGSLFHGEFCSGVMGKCTVAGTMVMLPHGQGWDLQVGLGCL